uniref:Putative secreted protein n=1 Tax=Anopheles darlingi TaxID=43151 RepID=A0A2M4D148_ANODA
MAPLGGHCAELLAIFGLGLASNRRGGCVRQLLHDVACCCLWADILTRDVVRRSTIVSANGFYNFSCVC